MDDFDSGGTQVTSDNLTTLDLFRFASGNRPTTFAQFQNLPRELTPGVASVLTDTIVAYEMSTGRNMGDGQQAGHWQDDGFFFNPIGIMDPTLPYGVYETISGADLRAFELIGYNTPEPGRVALLFISLGALVFRRRR